MIFFCKNVDYYLVLFIVLLPILFLSFFHSKNFLENNDKKGIINDNILFPNPRIRKLLEYENSLTHRTEWLYRCQEREDQIYSLLQPGSLQKRNRRFVMVLQMVPIVMDSNAVKNENNLIFCWIFYYYLYYSFTYLTTQLYICQHYQFAS